MDHSAGIELRQHHDECNGAAAQGQRMGARPGEQTSTQAGSPSALQPLQEREEPMLKHVIPAHVRCKLLAKLDEPGAVGVTAG